MMLRLQGSENECLPVLSTIKVCKVNQSQRGYDMGASYEMITLTEMLEIQ